MTLVTVSRSKEERGLAEVLANAIIYNDESGRLEDIEHSLRKCADAIAVLAEYLLEQTAGVAEARCILANLGSAVGLYDIELVRR